MKFLAKQSILLVVLLAMSACSLPFTTAVEPPTAQPTTPEALLAPVITLTPADGQCAFVEGRKQLVEISNQLEEKLKTASLPIKNARAEAYGENCVTADGSVVRFAARETDFYISLIVPDLKDDASLGGMLEQVLTSIEQFPVGQTPGPNPGYIGVSYQAEDSVVNLWFMRSTAVDLIAQGVRGADLYRRLQNQP